MPQADHNEADLTSAQRALLAEVRRIQEAPPPSTPAKPGCIAALTAGGALVTLPFSAAALELSGIALWVVVGILALVILVGAYLSVFGDAVPGVAVHPEIDGAIGDLEAAFRASDQQGLELAAVGLLMSAYTSRGATTVSTYDPDIVRQRLGDILPSVLAVEEFLAGRKKILRVFTSYGQTEEPPRAIAQEELAPTHPGGTMAYEPLDLEALSDIDVSYRIARSIHKPNRRVLVVSFSGEYRGGSDGNPDARYMLLKASAGLAAVHRRAGIVLDLTDLEYVWGDLLETVFAVGNTAHPSAVPLAVVVGRHCEAAVRTLILGIDSRKRLRTVKWVFRDLDKACEYVLRDDCVRPGTPKTI